MKILLLEEWMSYPKGCTLDIVTQKANELVNRGVAENVTEKSVDPLLKTLDSPPVDKMLRRRTAITK